ncbi:uncharacterized protein BYT42DRAFT_592591 [Radiomyces spectabilis]|uniref:uncharacterized protein n=1 Tax=Radiomyces spectabilis TaxID=64574 RepID=UPI00221FB5E2|nr:uncharacterized protein BYT42DRAFT_592591 [Radiomyces spectabilis]KAI8384218.1 hypothetical protein BYT42DRAFT_592591 [Radiomyces spectabilis]
MSSGGRPRYWLALSERSVGWLLWSIGAAIFVQGHDFNEAHPELVAQYPVLHDIYLNMQTTWEHDIAHYMYAGGGMWMSWVQLFAFRNQIHGPFQRKTLTVWLLGIVMYGLLLAGVAIEFPWGLYVGLAYTIIISAICLIMMVYNRQGLKNGGLRTMGRRMVLQYYLGACVIGFIVIIIWLAIFGFKNRKAAGVAVH